jgi:hypothetical protein
MRKVGRVYDICRGTALTPDKCARYRWTWDRAVGIESDEPRLTSRAMPVEGVCANRKEFLRDVPCELCGLKHLLVPIHACEIHGVCAPKRYKSGSQEHPCFGCREQVQIVKLNADAWGHGDACLSAWISEGAKGGPLRVVHVAHGGKRELLELLGQEVTDDASNSYTIKTLEGEEHSRRGSVERVAMRAAALGIESPPKRPTPVISEDTKRWARQEARNVLLFPQTDGGGARMWPVPYWNELHALLARSGRKVLTVCGTPDHRFTGDYLQVSGWERTAALIEASDLVIGNDSAAVHVATCTETPAIALMGPTGANVFSHAKNVLCFSTPKSEVACSTCYFQEPYSNACGYGCVALSALTPEYVFDNALAVLADTPT